MYSFIKSFKSTREQNLFTLNMMVPTFITILVSNSYANSKEDNSYLYTTYVPIN